MSTMERRPIVTVVEGEFPVFGLESVAPDADLRIVTPERLTDVLADTEVLFLWDFFSPIEESTWERTHALRWIHVAAAGVDKLLTPTLIRSPIMVTNAHGIFDRRIAEYVLACVAASFKQLRQTIADQQTKTWTTRTTRNLAGARVLVIGAGGIGRATARLLRAVGMDVTVMGRTERTDDEFGHVLSTQDLPGRIGAYDVVVGALPLTEHTLGIVSADVIDALKPGAYFVNVGRGRTVDQDALTASLRTGRLSGAALDTFEQEPLPPEDWLWSSPDVLVSPHMSSRTDGWLAELVAQFCANYAAWRAGIPLSGVIDKELGFVR